MQVASPKTSELPPSALGIDTKSRGYEPGDEKPDLKVPDQIKLGDNTLHFDATKKDPVAAGRPGGERGDRPQQGADRTRVEAELFRPAPDDADEPVRALSRAP